MTKLTAKYWLRLQLLIGLECEHERNRKKLLNNAVSTTTCAACHKAGNKVKNHGPFIEYWCPRCSFGWTTLDLEGIKKSKESVRA